MRKSRISIRFLMTVVVLVGLALAALKYPADWSASAIYTLVFGLLLFSLVGMMVRRGDKQLFWAGFGAFGFGYLLHAFEFSNNSVPKLFFMLFIEASIRTLSVPVEPDGEEGGTFLSAIFDDGSNSSHSQSQILHTLIAIVCGLFGTQVVRLFATKEEDARPTDR